MRALAFTLVALAFSGCSLSADDPALTDMTAPPFDVSLAGLHSEPSGHAVVHRHDEVDVSVRLPPAFAFQGHVASADGFGMLHFVDEAGGRFFAVEVHDYLTAPQRADWAEFGGASLSDAVRAFDPTGAAVPVDVGGFETGTSAMRIETPNWDSAVVQTCQGTRCTRIRTNGPLGSLNGDVLRSLAGAVRRV